jgi:hypothetical protein
MAGEVAAPSAKGVVSHTMREFGKQNRRAQFALLDKPAVAHLALLDGSAAARKC